jgi:hypothetical protein
MLQKLYTNSGLILLAVLAAGVWTSGGLSSSPAESALSQSGGPSEKEWQFHDLSGTPIWVVSNEAVGHPPIRRDIYILIESKYFRKEILTKVFRDLSRKATDVDWVVIRACSDREVIRQMIIIDILDGACIPYWKFTDEEKKAWGLSTNSSAKKERVFDARYFAGFGREFFHYTPVAGPETAEEVVLRASFKSSPQASRPSMSLIIET